MTVEHDALMLRIYVSESRRRNRAALLDAMLAHGLRGAATFRGIGGFGSTGRMYRTGAGT